MFDLRRREAQGNQRGLSRFGEGHMSGRLGNRLTIDLLEGCTSAQAGLSWGLQSRRALSAVAKGSLGSRPNEAF
jgi:hypothetical protein